MIETFLYKDDIKYTASMALNWEMLQSTYCLVTGASGMIGSYLIDVIMYKNTHDNLKCKIYAVGRDKKKAKEKFFKYWESEFFEFISHDVNLPLQIENCGKIDYILHLASNTHPVAYATDPIGTITANIIGTNNLLRFAVDHSATRFVFASSNEIYGENRGDVEFFDEMYCGYIDSNTMRAGYPESKRCGESLCQAYRKQKKLNVVIPRFTRTYGPTMLMNDTKAISQFIKKGCTGEDIVLKSDGSQYYSYTYVADAVSGLLTILFKGISGEAYNVSDQNSDIMLKDLASIIAEISGKQVVFGLPNNIEKSGYSKATKARLDGKKISDLGWHAKYDIKLGVSKTIEILRNS